MYFYTAREMRINTDRDQTDARARVYLRIYKLICECKIQGRNETFLLRGVEYRVVKKHRWERKGERGVFSYGVQVYSCKTSMKA